MGLGRDGDLRGRLSFGSRDLGERRPPGAHQVRVSRPRRQGAASGGRRFARHLPAARDGPSRRRALHRPHLQAQALHGAAQAFESQTAERDGVTLRLAFLGTPDFAVPTLAELVAQGHDIACVYSQPPRPKGRGLDAQPSPVHEFALTSQLAVRTPATLKDAAQQELFAGLELDAAIVVAYGLLLPKPILDAPKLGCFNLHASLLPRWRGAAPIQRAIMAGDEETGAMIMRMEEGLDTGPVLMAERASIGRRTYGELHDLLSRLGADLMLRALGALERGTAGETPQAADGVTYAKKIAKDA